VTIYDTLVSKIWKDSDPYSGIDRNAGSLAQVDLQGWNSKHGFLRDVILESAPSVIVEIGVWKGGSTVFMAGLLKEQARDAAVIAVDTWRGSCEHWLREDWRKSLGLGSDDVPLYEVFRRNVVAREVDKYIVPLPLDSVNTAELLMRLKIVPDMIHIDGGHDYRSVLTDLELWWDLLAPNGYLIGDDYNPSGKAWPGVTKAVDEFVARHNTLGFRASGNKFSVRKPE
jgi:predicted O-methyltransferase YrrM